MASFVVRRVLLSVVMLVAVSYGSFVLIATKFSSICSSQFTPNTKYPPLADSVSHATSLWGTWLRGLPSGKSFTDSCPALGQETIVTGLGHTAALLGLTIVLVLLLSLATGVLAALTAGTRLDLVVRACSYGAWAVPPFLLALGLQSGLASLGRHGLHPFPVSGWPGLCPPGFFTCLPPPNGHGLDQPARHGLAQLVAVLRSLAVPSLSLAIAFVGLHGRYLRSALLAAFGAPYTSTARAKGLSESRIVVRHALRNSLGVFSSVLLLDVGAVVGGSLAVDYVFRLGGLGDVFLNQIGALGDLSGDSAKYVNAYAVMSVLALTAVFVAVASLLAELLLLWLDPRTRPA